MRHIHSKTPLDVQWHPCVHKPTIQRWAENTEDVGVETKHGEMIGREDIDVILEGDDGKSRYVIEKKALRRCYYLGDEMPVEGGVYIFSQGELIPYNLINSEPE